MMRRGTGELVFDSGCVEASIRVVVLPTILAIPINPRDKTDGDPKNDLMTEARLVK